jgi:hypothetical protein
MHFALLVSQLPRVDEARAQYDEMLTLEPRTRTMPSVAAALWTALKKLAQ